MLLALLLVLSAGCESNPRPLFRAGMFRHPGRQWLAWDSRQQENFVYGYIQGYRQGVNQACHVVDQRSGRGDTRTMGTRNVPATVPPPDCDASLGQYSMVGGNESAGPNFSAYTTLITEFYRKYPDSEDIPFTRLMEPLTGPTIPTVIELHRKFEQPSAQ
jgi:hypothetical protein